MDAVHYAAVGSHLYYNHNWLPIDGGGYTHYANEGYEFLHCLITFIMGNAPLSRGIVISFIAFMLGSFFYLNCLQYFFTLRESQLILLMQLPVLGEVVLPLTDSVGWCFFTALMWIFMKKDFRASFAFGLLLGAGYLCRNQILIIFLPLPILMGTPSTWKKDWKTLSWDLCRCVAGFFVSLAVFETLVYFWVETPATSGNFYVDYYEIQAATVQNRFSMFVKYCIHFLRFRYCVYGVIVGVPLLFIGFCSSSKFACRFAWFILFSSAATFLSYAVLKYSSDCTANYFPVRYLIYYYSSIVPFMYYFATVIVQRVVPLPNRISGARVCTVLLTIVSFLLFFLPLYISYLYENYFIFAKHSENGLSYVNLYRNELALSKELCRIPSSKPSLFVLFGDTKIEWYQALYPVSSYEADTLVSYREANLEKRQAAIKNYFNDYELQKYSRITILVDKTFLNGLYDETDKIMFKKFLSDERFTKAFDRKEYDCKDCVFFLFIQK